MTTFEELSFLKGREQEALLAAGFSNALDLLKVVLSVRPCVHCLST